MNESVTPSVHLSTVYSLDSRGKIVWKRFLGALMDQGGYTPPKHPQNQEPLQNPGYHAAGMQFLLFPIH